MLCTLHKIIMPNSPVKNPESNYFDSLRKKSTKSMVEDVTKAKTFITKEIDKIGKEIETGTTVVRKHIFLDGEVKSPRHKPLRDIDLLDREILENQELYQQAKKQIFLQRKKEKALKEEENQFKRAEFQDKIAHWRQMKEELKEKRLKLEEARLLEIEEEENRLKLQEEEQAALLREQKKSIIQERIKKIQDNKKKREENKSQSVQNLNPKYIQMAKKYKQFQEEIKFQEEIIKKNKKLSMKLDHSALKVHQKQYLTKVQERKKSLGPQQNDQRQDFKKFFAKDEEETKKEQQKRKRRLNFQQKLKEVPLEISESKRIKVQIAIDKSKNPLKYNFLSQKSLNDFQIYGEFKDFSLNIKPRELGNNYLKQICELNKQIRANKTISVRSTHNKLEQKKIYKNYLQDLKNNRVQKSEDEIIRILKTHKEKHKAIEQLNERSKKFEREAQKYRHGYGKQGLKNSIQNAIQADEMYMKSIEAKLACLQID